MESPRWNHRDSAPGRQTAGSARPPWRHPAVLAIAAYGLVFAAWTRFHWGGPAARADIADLAFLPVSAIGTVFAVILARRVEDRRRRRAWYLIALALALWWLGDIDWCFSDLVVHSTPFPSWSDAGYLGFYPALMAGLLQFQVGPADRSHRLKLALDTAAVTIAAAMVLWFWVIGPTTAAESFGSGLLVLLAYPIGDAALIFALTVVQLRRPGSPDRQILSLFTVSLAIFVVADVGSARSGLSDTYQAGSWPDACYMVAQCLMVIGVCTQYRHQAAGGASRVRAGRPVPSRQRQIAWLPYAAMITGFALLGAVAVRDAGAPLGGLVLGTLALACVVMIRQLAAQRENQQLAFHDSLTGLANRALLYDRVEHALAGSPRRGTVALCFCDLDGFKTINDSLGHHAGDEVLTVTGQRLETITRPGDTVGRLGGDEFAVLMENIDPQMVDDLAARIVSVLRQPLELDQRQISLSVSVGVAFGNDTTTAGQLFREADSAMYEAKTSGKNRFKVFAPEMHARIVERLELANAFRGALERSEFSLQYQPYLSLVDGRLEGFEALVRWRHPSLGMVVPLRFVPLAEETRFIVPLGRWILETACEEAAHWPQSPRPLSISVNLSGLQLQAPELVDDVRTALSLSGLPAERLTLEITESVLMIDAEHAAKVLAELKALGVHLAIDDFGTGYSSLSYLQQFPVDVLKIDKGFVDPLQYEDGDSVALISTIVSLARSLGMTTVAEGIEHQAQRRRLTELDCDTGQGYLLSRPLDPADVRTFIIGATAAPSDPTTR